MEFYEVLIREKNFFLKPFLEPRKELKFENDQVDSTCHEEEMNSPSASPSNEMAFSSGEKNEESPTVQSLKNGESSMKLRCYHQCFKRKNHQLKHEIDFSSPLGVLLAQRDKVDDKYIKNSLLKLDNLCSTSRSDSKGLSSKKAKK